MSSARAFSLNRQIFNASLHKRVQALWFADIPADATCAPFETVKKWFGAGDPAEKETFDSSCRSDFQHALDAISPSHIQLPQVQDFEAEKREAETIAAPFMQSMTLEEDQIDSPTAALSMLILLDQMPRNIFRDNQNVIYSHYDRLSRAVIASILDRQPRLDLDPKYRFSPVRRMWFYMPLMHSEHLEDHATFEKELQSVMQDVASKGDQAAADYVQKTLNAEKMHFDILKRFGRYPHRNQALGRNPTKEEEEWLEASGQHFGTSMKAKSNA